MCFLCAKINVWTIFALVCVVTYIFVCLYKKNPNNGNKSHAIKQLVLQLSLFWIGRINISEQLAAVYSTLVDKVITYSDHIWKLRSEAKYT